MVIVCVSELKGRDRQHRVDSSQPHISDPPPIFQGYFLGETLIIW
uniref:Uncharacterized protein n=1 Tax=Nelumbo nucifera TaxID=4432 RepID=A0A822ZRI7_NELNU|nr:TPA_asm: hypothetical protein HUJ06_004190 [Nelumbo nucifera]